MDEAKTHKLNEIYRGWKNYIIPNPRVEEIAKKRARICVNCSKITKKNICNVCGCYIPAKTRSEKSRCPLNKW